MSSSSSECAGSPVETMDPGPPVPSSPQYDRPRSLSMMIPDHYYCPEELPGTSYDTGRQFKPEDIGRLENVHGELLFDNFRLWECINSVRCGYNRVPATDILKRIYALSDNEFLRHYPAYADFCESGNGALNSMSMGGGRHDAREYMYHLLEHNSGLMRENARLKHCVHLLTIHKAVSVDAVVSHCFGLDDDAFVRAYPTAERDHRLRASLKKLKEEGKKKMRAISLPGPLQSLASRFSGENRRSYSEYRPDHSMGPSQPGTTNRDMSNCHHADTQGADLGLGCGTSRAQMDVMFKPREGGRQRGVRWNEGKGRSDSFFGDRMPTAPAPLAAAPPWGYQRRASVTPESRPQVSSKTRGKGSKTRGAAAGDPFSCGGGKQGHSHHPQGRTGGQSAMPVAYMVQQHPYNWAASNSSSIKTTEDDAWHSQQRPRSDVQQEGDEDNGLSYRKSHNASRHRNRDRVKPSASDLAPVQAPDKSPVHKGRGPRISYSRSPAGARRSCLTRAKHGIHVDDDEGGFTHRDPKSVAHKPLQLAGNKSPLAPVGRDSGGGKKRQPDQHRARRSQGRLCEGLPTTRTTGAPQVRKPLPAVRNGSQDRGFADDSKYHHCQGYDYDHHDHHTCRRNKTANYSLTIDDEEEPWEEERLASECENGMAESGSDDAYNPTPQFPDPTRERSDLEQPHECHTSEQTFTPGGRSCSGDDLTPCSYQLSRELERSRRQLLELRESCFNSVRDHHHHQHVPRVACLEHGTADSAKSGGHQRPSNAQRRTTISGSRSRSKEAGNGRRQADRGDQLRAADADRSTLRNRNRVQGLQGRKDEDLPGPISKHGCRLSQDKPHRVPIGKSAPPTTKGKMGKQMNTNCSSKPRRKQCVSRRRHVPLHQKEEGISSDSLDSSQEKSSDDQAENKVHYIHIPQDVLRTPDSISDPIKQLIEEKRQLYQKYQGDSAAAKATGEGNTSGVHSGPDSRARDPPPAARQEKLLRPDRNPLRPSMQDHPPARTQLRQGLPSLTPAHGGFFGRSYSFDDVRHRPPPMDPFLDRPYHPLSRPRPRSPSFDSFLTGRRYEGDMLRRRPPSHDPFVMRHFDDNMFPHRMPTRGGFPPMLYDHFLPMHQEGDRFRRGSSSYDSFLARHYDAEMFDRNRNRSLSHDNFPPMPMHFQEDRFRYRSPSHDEFVAMHYGDGRGHHRSLSQERFLDWSHQGFHDRPPSGERFFGRSNPRDMFQNETPSRERSLHRSGDRSRKRSPSHDNLLDRTAPEDHFWKRSLSCDRCCSNSTNECRSEDRQENVNVREIFQDILDMRKKFQNKLDVCERFNKIVDTRDKLQEKISQCESDPDILKNSRKSPGEQTEQQSSWNSSEQSNTSRSVSETQGTDSSRPTGHESDTEEEHHQSRQGQQTDSPEPAHHQPRESHRVTGPRRFRSLSQPSPRPFKPVSIYGKKRLTFSDPLCHTCFVQKASGCKASKPPQHARSQDSFIHGGGGGKSAGCSVASSEGRMAEPGRPERDEQQQKQQQQQHEEDRPHCEHHIRDMLVGSPLVQAYTRLGAQHPPPAGSANAISTSTTTTTTTTSSTPSRKKNSVNVREPPSAQGQTSQANKPKNVNRNAKSQTFPVLQEKRRPRPPCLRGAKNRLPSCSSSGDDNTGAGNAIKTNRLTRSTSSCRRNSSSDGGVGGGGGGGGRKKYRKTRRETPRQARGAEGSEGESAVVEARSSSSLQGLQNAPPTLLGEMAFQLEQRIIRSVFIDGGVSSELKDKNVFRRSWGTAEGETRHRFYGFTVQNMPQKIRSDCRDPVTDKRDTARQARLLRRYQDVIAYLRHNFSYHVHKHGRLSQQLIQKYGVFTSKPDSATIIRLGLNDFRTLRNHVIRMTEASERMDMLVLVDCLKALAQKEGQPVLTFH